VKRNKRRRRRKE